MVKGQNLNFASASPLSIEADRIMNCVDKIQRNSYFYKRQGVQEEQRVAQFIFVIICVS